MPNVIEMPNSSSRNIREICASASSRPRSTAYYRRLLCEMRVRPASQRAILRRLLQRAAANGVRVEFPVPIPDVVAP